MSKQNQFHPNLLPLDLDVINQQSQLKQNYHRKPIFKGNNIQIPSRVSMRNSLIINEHLGDQTPCHDDQISQILQQKKNRVNNQNTSNKPERQYRKWHESSSSDSQQIDQKNKFGKLSIINYPAIKIANLPKIFEPLTLKTINKSQEKQKTQQNLQSASLDQAALQKLKFQNQILKNQQFLLTQMVLSNQKKLRDLQNLQNLQVINVDYKKKIFYAKSILQKWQENNENYSILNQLKKTLTI